MAVYATAANILARYDSRRIAELNSDSGSPVTPTDPLSFSTPVGVAILDASSVLDAALQSGKRYSKTALTALIADTDETKGAIIRQVTCDLAYANLITRRGLPSEEIDRLVPRYKASLEWVEQLRNGNAVLDITANLAAGLPQAGLTGNPWDWRQMSNWNKAFGFFPDNPAFPYYGYPIWP